MCLKSNTKDERKSEWAALTQTVLFSVSGAQVTLVSNFNPRVVYAGTPSGNKLLSILESSNSSV